MRGGKPRPGVLLDLKDGTARRGQRADRLEDEQDREHRYRLLDPAFDRVVVADAVAAHEQVLRDVNQSEAELGAGRWP